MFWALQDPQKPKAMSPPSDLQAWIREDWKRDSEKPPNPLHLDYTFSVPSPCLLSTCEGICPACSGAPASWLPSRACPSPGWYSPAICRQLWWPPHGEPPSCACGRPCRAACCAFAPVHAPCPSPLGEGLEGHLHTPRASLLTLCAGGGCLWGECCSYRQGAGCPDCPARQPAEALAETTLLAHGICVQVLLAMGWTFMAEAKVRLPEDQEGWEGWACRSPAEVCLALCVLVDCLLGILSPVQAGQFSMDAGSLHC